MKRKLLIIFALAFLFRLIFAFVIWHPDVNNHIDWGIRFFDYGPRKFFAPETNVWSYTWPNQPPGTIYIYAGIRKLFEFVFNAFWLVNIKVPAFPSVIMTFFESNLYPALLKLPSILSDLGIGVLIYLVVKELTRSEKKSFLATTIWLLNPIIWFNSAVWGQTDALISFFALLAFYLLHKRKLVWAVLFLAISFYIKVSLAIFIPIFVITALRQKYKFIHIALALGVSMLFIGLITLPFSGGEPFSWLINIYQKKVLFQQLHVITANAFNVWAAIAGIHERPNTLLLGPLSYATWGSILFTVSYLPLVVFIWKKQDLKRIIWVLALVAFSSFMLLTNMHERYLFPLFPYLTILSVVYLQMLWVLALVSLISLLNLYNFWFTPRIEPIVSIMSFGDRIMPRILGFVNFSLYLYVYSYFLRHFHKGKI